MPEALEQLVAKGLVGYVEGRARTTRRWQGAMARAALGLQRAGVPWQDLRLPVVTAMIEQFPECDDGAIADLVQAMLVVEESELAPLWQGASPPP